MNSARPLAAALALATAAVAQGPPAAGPARIHADEVHLRNLRQLTFGGQNAEGYWSPDGRRIIFQSMNEAEGVACDQAFVLDLDSGATRRVSTGRGRITCGYFLDGGRRILFSSTHLASPDCPPAPDRSRGYAWAMYAGYEIFSAGADGGEIARLTTSPGYDAEATVAPDGKTIVFTSVRDGDLEIYTMQADGTGVSRLTHEPGYDGGPFFSPDGRRIVYRRDGEMGEADLARYRERLANGLYQPGVLEIWLMDADGRRKRQVTRLGAASFAPSFHPDGRRVVFSSNHPEPRGRNFDLYLVRDDGTGLERVTSEPSFDGFPMFSPDGRRIVFASNRGGRVPGETNLFVADWVE
jgi:Tol biopolymer transport system component